MEALIALLVSLALAVLGYTLHNLRKVLIYEYERGLLYKRGKYVRLLGPGKHWYLRSIHAIQKLDVRTRLVSISGQEVLSADNVSIKISLICSYKVEDPYRAVTEVESYIQAMYYELQITLRDLVGETSIEELLSKRKEIGGELLARTKEKVLDFGVALESVAIKDVMFPGDLKRIFAQVVNARMEGLAALERARGESAALRKLANTARLLDKNPGLLQLRLLQTLENGQGNTIILGNMAEGIPLKNLVAADDEKS